MKKFNYLVIDNRGIFNVHHRCENLSQVKKKIGKVSSFALNESGDLYIYKVNKEGSIVRVGLKGIEK